MLSGMLNGQVYGLNNRPGCDRRRTCGGCRRKQVAHWRGPRTVNRGEDDALEKGEENLGHFEDRLVSQTAENKCFRLSIGKHFTQGGSQSPSTSRIVCHIEEPESLG